MTADSPLADSAHPSGTSLLRAEISGHVRVSVDEDGLRLSGPFGDLTVGYADIDTVVRDFGGGVRLKAAGAKLWLDLSELPDRVAFYDLLRDKIATQREHS